MLRTILSLIAATAAILGTSPARAQVMATSYKGHGCGATASCCEPSCSLADTCQNFCDSCNDCCDDCDDCCDDCCGSLLAMAELTVFRYHRADGIRVGGDVGDTVSDNPFQVSPRITVGYMGADGLGVRVRWWEYDLDATADEGAPSALAVDTYTFDLEVFDRVQLNCVWVAEISAGIRYNSFDETLNDLVGETEVRINSFNGFGGVVGLELRRCIGSSAAVFARARAAILMDDKDVINSGSGAVTLLDSTQGMTELAMGVLVNYDLGDGYMLVGSLAAEWQNWFNYSSSFSTSAVDPEQFYTGASDVGFGGVVFGLGLTR